MISSFLCPNNKEYISFTYYFRKEERNKVYRYEIQFIIQSSFMKIWQSPFMETNTGRLYHKQAPFGSVFFFFDD